MGSTMPRTVCPVPQGKFYGTFKASITANSKCPPESPPVFPFSKLINAVLVFNRLERPPFVSTGLETSMHWWCEQ